MKEKTLEARAGIEPANKGFADLCLTTWLPRLIRGRYSFTITQRSIPFHAAAYN